LIKYIGSKRRLVPILGEMFVRAEGRSAVDAFSGTTRVAQEMKRRGYTVTAVDSATYSHMLGRCYIETDASSVDLRELRDAIQFLNTLKGSPGYFTQTFCIEARFFQPKNGERVDAIRDYIETELSDSWMYPILLVSLMEAADRVDSTTGVQMAFLKTWAPRAHNDMELRLPKLLPGEGTAVLGDALDLVPQLSSDLVYLDPPYNQHRYFTNYHIWETLVRWDAPEAYGVARKRIDSRSDSTKSIFNMKNGMPEALGRLIRNVAARTIVLSYNNESWISLEELCGHMSVHGHVEALAFDSRRYVGALIGIHNPQGQKVGSVSHVRNLEYVIVAGEREGVQRICAGLATPQQAQTAQTALF
jgi:adenine-specific DNA-methyltransferase